MSHRITDSTTDGDVLQFPRPLGAIPFAPRDELSRMILELVDATPVAGVRVVDAAAETRALTVRKFWGLVR